MLLKTFITSNQTAVTEKESGEGGENFDFSIYMYESAFSRNTNHARNLCEEPCKTHGSTAH